VASLRRVSVWLLVAVCSLAALPWVGAQVATPGGFGAQDQSAPPPSFVLDDDDLFRSDSKTLREIRDRLGEFYDRHELPVYLAVYAGLIGSTPGERAEELRREWLGERYGFVMVYDTDTGELGLGRSLETCSDGADGDPATEIGRIPSYELIEVMLKVRENLGDNSDRIAHLDTLTKQLVTEFDACLERLEAPPRRGPMLMFAFAVIGAIAAMALVAMFAASWISRADEQSSRTLKLPDVLVGQRLGAPCGGGRISSREFREPSGDS